MCENNHEHLVFWRRSHQHVVFADVVCFLVSDNLSNQLLSCAKSKVIKCLLEKYADYYLLALQGFYLLSLSENNEGKFC